MTILGPLLMVLLILIVMEPTVIVVILMLPLFAWEMYLDYLKARDAARAGTAKGQDDELA